MRTGLVLLASIGVLAACAPLGPSYDAPPAGAAPHGADFVRAGAGASTAAPASAWWRALNDATLDALMARVLAANPSLDVARARLRQARANLDLEHANQHPSVGSSAAYAHARLPPGITLSQQSDSGATDLDLYNAAFDASWEIDLFGGKQRAVEAVKATAEAADATLADAWVSLSAETGNAYVRLRDVQSRQELGKQAVAREEDILRLTRQRLDRGASSRVDVTRAERQLEDLKTRLAPLEAQRAAYLDELAALSGEAPGSLDALLGAAMTPPMPPAEVAVGDPAALLRRRPDIRAAERQLAADTARIGQAEAARFPSIKFLGLIGIGGTQPDDLVHLDDFMALIAPQISWSFVDFGRNAARVGQAEAKRDEALAQYRQKVLDALRDAEDSLARFGSSRNTVGSLTRSKLLADEAAGLIEQRRQHGAASQLELLDAQRQQLSAAQDLTQAQANLTGDFVAIQKALGLGWEEQ